MEKLLLLTAMFAACYATPQDLSGKVIVFPRESDQDYVKILTNKTTLSSATVCLSFLTDLTREYGLFSMFGPSYPLAFVLFKMLGRVSMYAWGGSTYFQSLSFPPNTWHSLCATWSSDNGLAQLWVNGKPTIKRFIQSRDPFTETPITILGQNRLYHGGFTSSQSFVGMISKVHMWDHVISAKEIQGYMNGDYFSAGNVFNWRALEYEISGMALVDQDPENFSKW